MTSRLVIGGYTSEAGGGIGVAALMDGRCAKPVLVAEAANPTFLVVSADGRFMYAVLQDADAEGGAVGAWAVAERDGPWAALGEQPTGGEGPCHLTLSPDERFLAAANYESGSVSVHPVNGDGSLGERADLVAHAGPVGPVADRQDGPHAHQVVFGPSGHLFACDLGLDAVIAYHLDGSTGRLSEVARCAVAPGTGPRHLAFAPDGSTAWVVGELASTLTVCAVDGPSLTPVATVSSRADGAQGENLAAEIVVSADGSEVFVSNRGDDTVAAFAVDGRSVRLKGVADCGGHWPRWVGFGEDEDSLVVTNERSDSVTVLSRVRDQWSVSDTAEWKQPTVAACVP
jgi:6-phosphogluconolactonase